ncbi:MAG: DUF2141 domain-containing protein [Sandaracinaceae bacterium]|nr:DUF2141 domain-containing protein [Sandaracinaceae bacterium]
MSHTPRTAWLLPALVVLATCASLSPTAAQEIAPRAAGSRIELVVEGLHGGGHVRAGAYADAGSWLGSRSVVNCVAPVQGGRARCVMELPREGAYAIGLFHDADDDGELDRGVFGVPTEGYGFSRNVGGGLSAPSFASAALQVAANALVQAVVRIRYGL